MWNWGSWGTVGGYLVNGGAGNKAKGISISAREFARFGHLFLNRGNWNGTQLISSLWVDQATSLQVPLSVPWNGTRADVGGVYGFNWWVQGTERDGTLEWPGAPLTTYAACGHNNNRCFVVPEWDMVIVRLGTDGDISADYWGEALKRIGGAITGSSTPSTVDAGSKRTVTLPADQVSLCATMTDPTYLCNQLLGGCSLEIISGLRLETELF